MITLGILTDHNNPNLVQSEKGLDDAFTMVGIQNRVLIWDNEDWLNYKNILLRTPWDYTQKIDLFTRKLIEAKRAGVNIIHDPQIIFWNMDKSYLIELASKINVVQTTVIESFKINDLGYLYEKYGNTIVIKPKIGAGGKNTFKINSSDDTGSIKLLENQSVLIQPFIKSIETQGEYSFIFFDGQFSHAVVKKAKSGEFRIQQEYGGQTTKYFPQADEIKQTANMLKTLDFETVYARVDVVRLQNKLFLMEMEIIEPELFLPYSKEATSKLVCAVKKKLFN